MYLADQLNKFSLSREGLEKHKKKRQKREDEAQRQRHLERQEELAQKREEERRNQYQLGWSLGPFYTYNGQISY